jgi:hypothetical protein
VNDQDRRDIITALDRESRSEQNRILATFTSFKNWMYIACYVAYRKLVNKLETLWNWLRMGFS